MHTYMFMQLYVYVNVNFIFLEAASLLMFSILSFPHWSICRVNHISFIHSFIHSTIHSSIHLFIHLSIHPSINPFIHPFIHPSIHPFIHSSIHPSIHTSIVPLTLLTNIPVWFRGIPLSCISLIQFLILSCDISQTSRQIWNRRNTTNLFNRE